MIITSFAHRGPLTELSPYLSVPSSFHHCHNDVLCGHEGQLVADVSLYDFRVDDQTLCDVLQSAEDDVCREEGLGQGDPPVPCKLPHNTQISSRLIK